MLHHYESTLYATKALVNSQEKYPHIKCFYFYFLYLLYDGQYYSIRVCRKEVQILFFIRINLLYLVLFLATYKNNRGSLLVFNPRPQLLVVVAQASQGQIDPINGAYSYILVGDALYNNLPAFWLSRQFKGLSRLRVYNPHLVEAAHLIRKRFFSSFYTPKVLP